MQVQESRGMYVVCKLLFLGQFAVRFLAFQGGELKSEYYGQCGNLTKQRHFCGLLPLS